MDLFSEALSGAEHAGVAMDSYSLSLTIWAITSDHPGRVNSTDTENSA